MKQQVLTEKLQKIYNNDIVTEQMLDDMLFEAAMELIISEGFLGPKGMDEMRPKSGESFKDFKERKRKKEADHDTKLKAGAVTGVAAGATAAVTGAALYGMYKLIKKWTTKSKDPNATDAQKVQAKEKVASLKKKVAQAKKAKK